VIQMLSGEGHYSAVKRSLYAIETEDKVAQQDAVHLMIYIT